MVRVSVVYGPERGARFRGTRGYSQQARLRSLRAVLRLAAGDSQFQHRQDPWHPWQQSPGNGNRMDELAQPPGVSRVAARSRAGGAELDGVMTEHNRTIQQTIGVTWD